MQLHEETLFQEAMEIANAKDRDKFLDKACQGNDELRRRVERLIAVYPKGSVLEPVDETAAETGSGESVRERLGDTIGPYKLLERLGEGGMGVVYMAEQSKPVRRQVALKIIKVGMDTAQVVARFEAERQALALMSHPNIAKILDAGETESGRPYFVMELVRGIPITEFCDQQKLDLRQRLELFTEVCKAVQHAHQKGVIHRDIKPSNLLVELHDVKGVPKVIDFGIAKATNQRLTERTLFTQFSQMVGTPIYMSPEQAHLSGLDIDTRTDIYSLGILLYEFLTGTTPVTREALSKVGYDELRRMIQEDEPPLASARISTLKAEAISTLATNQRAPAHNIASQLRGDLDWVVVKALEKDRTRRYQSALDFADDIQRYLVGEPVEAHPPSLAYRTSKLVRRYKTPLAVAAAVMLLMIATTAVSIRFAIAADSARQQADDRRIEADNERQIARKERTEAESQRNRAIEAEELAKREAANTKALNDFLVDDLLGKASPRTSPNGVGQTVEELLDVAASKAEEKLADQPEVHAQVQYVVGDAYFSMGRRDKATKHLERAVEIQRELRGSNDMFTRKFANELAMVYLSNDRAGDAVEILSENLQALRDMEDGEADSRTLATMNNLVWAYTNLGRYQEAVDLEEQVLELSERVNGFEDSRTLQYAMVLADR